jgi:hypothetical protein
MLILINIARVLLATIRDKGLSPCPRCLTPKSGMDQTGAKRDSQFREKNVRKYLLNYVRAARDAIYKRASAICGVVIDRLLKPTSSVPTLVSSFCPLLCRPLMTVLVADFRTHSLTVWARTLISRGCLFQIYSMSSNWAFGRRCSHI